MKKVMFAVIALALVAAIATPALAVTAEFKGQYRVRGYYDSSRLLLDASDNSHAWMDMRFRLQTTFVINDSMSVVTRFDALDQRRFGTSDADNKYQTLDFDRAWMKIKTGYGLFEFGRMSGAQFGTTFMDDETERDRLKYTLPMGDFTVIAIFEKNVERDSLTYPAPDYSDSDTATYWLAGVYKSEPLVGGILLGYTNNKSMSDIAFSTHPYDQNFWTIDPYFTAKFDAFTVQGEAFWRTGKAMEFDRKVYSGVNKGLEDVDFDAWAWNLEGQYAYGPVSFQIGYAWMGGQGSDPKATKVKTLGTLGGDWDKLWILTTTENDDLYAGLGGPGVGNISGYGMTGQNGAKVFYFGIGYKPFDNLALNFVYGNAKAEAPLSDKWSKDYGSEYDFSVAYQINPNLQYKAIAAYLDAGDFWQFGDSSVKLTNNYSLFHEIVMSF